MGCQLGNCHGSCVCSILTLVGVLVVLVSLVPWCVDVVGLAELTKALCGSSATAGVLQHAAAVWTAFMRLLASVGVGNVINNFFGVSEASDDCVTTPEREDGLDTAGCLSEGHGDQASGRVDVPGGVALLDDYLFLGQRPAAAFEAATQMKRKESWSETARIQ